MEQNYLFVVLIGMGVVFFGLICIIFLTWLMGVIMKGGAKQEPVETVPAAPAAAPAPQGMAPELIAVITAVLSEETSIPANQMNIVNIKKI